MTTIVKQGMKARNYAIDEVYEKISVNFFIPGWSVSVDPQLVLHRHRQAWLVSRKEFPLVSI